MSSYTNPASEFASVCRQLGQQVQQTGVEWLASQFETAPWSEDFYRVLFAIVQRGHYLMKLVDEIQEAAPIATEAKVHIAEVLKAFRAESLAGNWRDTSRNYLNGANVNPIGMLAGVVQPHICYKSLDNEKVTELLDDVSQLIGWLQDQQISERDFIRQALLEGLKEFQFRLIRLRWLGLGFALNGLKDVIFAYMALERGFVDDGSMPIIDALLKKTETILKSVYSQSGFAKDIVERGDFLLRMYGATSMFIDATSVGSVALLTHQG